MRRRWRGLPLLVPSGPRSTVHSSMVPKGSNIFRTSSSVCCFPSIPTKSFRSSGGRAQEEGHVQDLRAAFPLPRQAGTPPFPSALPWSSRHSPWGPMALGVKGLMVVGWVVT